MATFHHGNSEILGSNDGSQTMVFMNPACVGLSDTQQLVGIPYNVFNRLVNLDAEPSVYQGLSLSLSSQKLNLDGEVQLSSRYLKAAQGLLDEIANVEKIENDKGTQNRPIVNSNKEPSGANEGRQFGEEKGANDGSEFTTAERQEIQMKKAKLVNMLDEVELRYKQYRHQIQIMISWFERAAGTRSAKSYTAVALQTISKQFRCLKDAILGQIKAANKSLGEDDILVEKTEGSRLKFVDNQIRRQRALQQLGMMHQHSWRPQRGLPERSVSVLRAWLFEHFLHPYPKDSDKILLAKQTGLTRSQVSNWFVNARVRLWKPMVEEMYVKEMKTNESGGSEDKHSGQEENLDLIPNSIGAQGNSPRKRKHNEDIIVKQEKNVASSVSTPAVLLSSTGSNIRNHSVFDLIRSSEIASITQESPKKSWNDGMLLSSSTMPSMNLELKHSDRDIDLMSAKFGIEQRVHNETTLMEGKTSFIRGFGPYSFGQSGRIGAEQYQVPFSGNGVSLTLGLQHCENLSVASARQTFLPNYSIQEEREIEVEEPNGLNTSKSVHSTNVYDHNNIQNRWRFTSQMLQTL